MFDTEDNPLALFEQSVAPGQIIVFEIRADCRTEKFLRSSPVPNVLIEGRVKGIGSFINLETTGLAVGAYSGQRKTFEIRATVNEAADYAIENVVFQIKS